MGLRLVKPVTLHILYYMPDYRHVLQEFTWAFEDQVPELVRTHKFLWHWKHHVDAVVSEVRLGIADQHVRTFQSVDAILRMN
jgi:uncharacterized protein Usg